MVVYGGLEKDSFLPTTVRAYANNIFKAYEWWIFILTE